MNEFDKQLTANIRRTIRSLRAFGTVAMHVVNLRSIVPTPNTTQGAPTGGNVQWQYAERFASIIKRNRSFREFTFGL